jgi:hypothetical protein
VVPGRSSLVARHEAGHAVVAMEVGLRFSGVFLAPGGVTLDGVRVLGGMRPLPGQHVGLIPYAMVLLAGSVSECGSRARPPSGLRRVNPGDLPGLVHLRVMTARGRPADRCSLRAVEAAAVEVLRRRWGAVLRVADALAARDLTESAVRRLVRGR